MDLAGKMPRTVKTDKREKEVLQVVNPLKSFLRNSINSRYCSNQRSDWCWRKGWNRWRRWQRWKRWTTRIGWSPRYVIIILSFDFIRLNIPLFLIITLGTPGQNGKDGVSGQYGQPGQYGTDGKDGQSGTPGPVGPAETPGSDGNGGQAGTGTIEFVHWSILKFLKINLIG